MSGNLKWRLIGIGMIALGAAVGWFFALGPLREAQAGAAQVSYEIKAFVAAPAAIVFGAFLLIGGEAVGALIGGPLVGRFQNATGPQRLALVAMLAVAGLACFGAWWWFDAQLTALGYRSAP